MGALSGLTGDVILTEFQGRYIELRPTLRAAIRAHELHGGFEPLFRKIGELDTWSMRKLIRAGAGGGAYRLIEQATARDLSPMQPQLLDFVLILANAGVRPVETDGDERDDAGPAHGDRHVEYFARVYKIATGWLGWTHDEAMNAPMPAILSAYIGRQEMLQAIFGGAGASSRNAIPLEDKLKAGMALLGTRKVARVRPAAEV